MHYFLLYITIYYFLYLLLTPDTRHPRGCRVSGVGYAHLAIIIRIREKFVHFCTRPRQCLRYRTAAQGYPDRSIYSSLSLLYLYFFLFLLWWRRCCVQKRPLQGVAGYVAACSGSGACYGMCSLGAYGCKDTTLSETVNDFFRKVINRVINSAYCTVTHSLLAFKRSCNFFLTPLVRSISQFTKITNVPKCLVSN